MIENNWYDPDNWYAPLVPEEKPDPPMSEEPPKQKKRSSRLLTGTLALLLVAAIIISSVVFGGPGQQIRIPVPGIAEKSTEKSPDSKPERTPNLPESSDGENDSSGNLPDSFRDYFDSYYTSVEVEIADIDIPREKVPVDFAVELTGPSQTELTFAQLYARCSGSVVSITGTIDGKDGYYWGTGFVISEDGVLVTNTHVIDSCDRATVTLQDGTEYEARLIGADSISDIAVLKIDAKHLKPVTIGDSAALAVGEPVAAIGNPLGETFKYTMTSGIISAIDRGISYNGHTMTLLQTDTALNEGNSGGPLFNMYGQVIGVTNMKMMSGMSSIEGIGFAIPSTTLKNIVNAILKDGEVRGRTSIGITVGAIQESAAKNYGLPEGLYISAVSEGSDAERQGILPGDILVAVNGIEVHTTDEVLAIKNECGVGDTMILTIWRDGKTMDVTITLMDTNDIYK